MMGQPESERPLYCPGEALVRAWNATIEAATAFSTSYLDYGFDAAKALLLARDLSEEALFRALGLVAKPLLGFLIEVFSEVLYCSEYDSVLVSFLQVLALWPDSTWEEPWTYTPKLSAVTTLVKVVYYVYYASLCADRVEARICAGTAAAEADLAELSITEVVVEHQALYLLELSIGRLGLNAFRWAAKVRNYGRTIAVNTLRLGHVAWEADTVLSKEVRLEMAQLFATVALALQRAREVLF
ncbi:MAG: hypothetical protein JWP44_4912 [Mucilaginibacter sp.]|nr:hypothetical protein [Mucilaginibacter sp.]